MERDGMVMPMISYGNSLLKTHMDYKKNKVLNGTSKLAIVF
jgi:hypothetical protein